MNRRAASLSLRAAQVLAEATPQVPSPCVSVCVMDPHKQVCEGCFRTLDEIASWSRLPDQAKRQVWQRIQDKFLEDDGR